MASVMSVNVGRPRLVGTGRRTVSTAIWKTPVEGRVAVRRVNVAGDDQADRSVHGGPDKAVYDTAIDLDTNGWDDPDYVLLAFVAGDQPFGGRECDTEPGEGFTGFRRRGASARVSAARAARVGSLEEDVDDLEEPVGDITRFDECLYTVGAQSRSGYVFIDRHHRRRTRSALSFDLEGPGVPKLNLLAFPGEEPPQIECNEDAGGEDTEE